MAGRPRSRKNQAKISGRIARRAELILAERRRREVIVPGRMAAARTKKLREPKKTPAKRPKRLWPSGYQSSESKPRGQVPRDKKILDQL
jgi:hypothetical protein